MYFSATIFALASLAVQSSLALVIPKNVEVARSEDNLVAREPHFFEIREPSPDYTLYSPNPTTSGAYGSFEFKVLDGEQSSEYHVKVYLQSTSGSKTEVANIPFDGYVASTTVSVSFDSFPDGTYTLIAEEFRNGDGSYAGELTQPFHIKQG